MLLQLVELGLVGLGESGAHGAYLSLESSQHVLDRLDVLRIVWNLHIVKSISAFQLLLFNLALEFATTFRVPRRKSGNIFQQGAHTPDRRYPCQRQVVVLSTLGVSVGRSELPSHAHSDPPYPALIGRVRSEERRVGKECRS